MNCLEGVQGMDKWDHRFMEMVKVIASWSSCYQSNRKIGALIVKNKRIITTGYNGAPSGYPSCVERGECLRRKANIPSGTKHEFCYAIHAEQNAIVQAAKLGISIEGATLYCTHQPCVICAKLIVNSGIIRVVYQEPYPDELATEIMKTVGIKVERYKLGD
jgi:dCMP deaminase